MAVRVPRDRPGRLRARRGRAEPAAGALGNDEVVPWFEQDLFCAVALRVLLDRLAREAPSVPSLSVFPPCDGAVRGLGSHGARAAGHPLRRAATGDGGHAHGRSRRPGRPTQGRILLAHPAAGPLAFVGEAFRCHHGRFPSIATGLNEIESAALEMLREGRHAFGDLFRAVSTDARVRRHGLGDVQLAACLRHLEPLVVRADDHAVEITPRGRGVLAGREDWLQIRPVDTWLAGFICVAGISGAGTAPTASPSTAYNPGARQRRLGDRRSRQRGGRKVRAPQGRVLANGQGGRPHGTVPQRTDRRSA